MIHCRVEQAATASALLKWWKINIIHQENIRTLILPVLLYGLEIWTLFKFMNKLEVLQMKCLGEIIWVSLCTHLQNKTIRPKIWTATYDWGRNPASKVAVARPRVQEECQPATMQTSREAATLTEESAEITWTKQAANDLRDWRLKLKGMTPFITKHWESLSEI